jgi:DNA-binding CsgD family transcriptional regulator
VLLERAKELATLTRLVEAARSGAPVVGVIEGAGGLGKSRLLAETRERAAKAGLRVLGATGRPIERNFSFGVVAQLFTPAVRDDPDSLLVGLAAPVAAIVAPERVPLAAETNAPTFAALHGLYGLAARLAEQGPVLLTVDDVHWCDAASLRFLAYLRNRLEGLPLALLCTTRPKPYSADPAALYGLLGDPGTVWIHPRPLSPAAAANLIETSLARAAEPAFTTACHRITGGNPLLLEQLVSALASEGVPPDSAHVGALEDVGPAAVASSVLLRIGRLGDDVVRTGKALAVLGDGAELAHVAELADLDVATAARAVAALARVDLVRATPPLGFVHPLVAAAVYRDVPVGERELHHLRAAALLREAAAPAERIASHLLRAPATADQAVVDQLVEAASAASRKGAVEAAAAYLERALAEPPDSTRRTEVSLALGQAQAFRNGPAAVANLRAAYDQLVDPERRGEVAEQLAAVLIFTGAGDQAIEVLRAAGAALPGESDVRYRLEAFELYGVLMGASEPAGLHRLAGYRSLPENPGVGRQMLAALAAVQWMYAGGPSTAVTDLAVRALADGALVATRPSWAAFGLSTLTFADRPEAEDWWNQLMAASYRTGSLTAMVGIMHGRGQALWRRGELADAESWTRDTLSAAAQWGFTELAPTWNHAQMAAILLDRGDVAGARRAWSSGRDSGANDPGTRIWLGCEIGILLAEGLPEAAVAAADAYAERFDALVPNPMDVPWRALKARALDQLGCTGEARELAEAELGAARAWGAPATVARTLRTLGALEGAAGLARLEEAVALVARSPARLEHARSLAALGKALSRAGRQATAREPLREALALAAACGADGLAGEVRAALHAAGGRPRRVALRGVDSLTPTELRVAQLAAEGHTNREVGETLFVTPKTVAMHLSNAYRKLGVSSRHDLPTALTNTGS